jgi:hypothetical protein
VDVKRLVKLGVVMGIVLNVIDFIVQGNLMAGLYAASPAFRNTADVIPFLVLGDVVAAFVFAWAYLKLGSATGDGPGGGALFGLYAGVLLAFPTYIFNNLLINNYPYSLAWTLTIYTIIVYVILGAIAGALKKR